MKTSGEAGTGIHKSDIDAVVWEFYHLSTRPITTAVIYLLNKIESNSI